MYYEKSIFIFHRSLRLEDNRGLVEALKNSEKVIPIFIFTPEQITDKNKFRSINSIIFMVEALEDLNKQLHNFGSKLFIFYGEQDNILQNILEQDDDIGAIYINEDYTDYAIQREKKLKLVATKFQKKIFSINDYLLHNINAIVTQSNTNYSKFTPYYHKIIDVNVDKPIYIKKHNYVNNRYKLANETTFEKIRKIFGYNGQKSLQDFEATKKEGLARISNIKNYKKYDEIRNNLFEETTRLSPYIKFGIVSIRNVYHRIKNLFGLKHDLIKQLYWREFYYNLAYNHLQLFEGVSYKPLYDNIKWIYNNNHFDKWKNGETGFPIVDAGMIELNETGFMHNRTRLITSNFLIKILGIDWRKGEKYYASKLVDYDPCVNNGNWQWSSGSGADSQPYFRIMNPWIQGKTHDPDCEYIKKWIPELNDVSNDDIHEWDIYYKKYDVDYPNPCVDYKKAKIKILKMYKKIYKYK